MGVTQKQKKGGEPEDSPDDFFYFVVTHLAIPQWVAPQQSPPPFHQTSKSMQRAWTIPENR